ncbi:hypothetical protein GPECTOR_11g144 [Gonium pectorale]|uniref:EF-hand domain-containing protein n=1 Tax=Gonium pectorale TaxID=33097 RepID=A0A150GPG6_GONPE|nr:hypothetical protein GPECTOR_11g144 [Gonium pectorale]|eukprot:KXZ51694.1 hypothetical protein GPECTOR_11g144 [Gonium pectorale]
MFGRFRGLRERIRARGERQEVELTLENSNLTQSQIATAKKALKILGLEARSEELSKQDFIVFLYAMGLELKTTMHELGDLLTEDEINAFMAIMDVNNDGVIGYNEFLATLKTQAPELAVERSRVKGASENGRSSGLHRAGAHHYSEPLTDVASSAHEPSELPLLLPPPDAHGAQYGAAFTTASGANDLVALRGAHQNTSGCSSPRQPALLPNGTPTNGFLATAAEAGAAQAEALGPVPQPPVLMPPPHCRKSGDEFAVGPQPQAVAEATTVAAAGLQGESLYEVAATMNGDGGSGLMLRAPSMLEPGSGSGSEDSGSPGRLEALSPSPDGRPVGAGE